MKNKKIYIWIGAGIFVVLVLLAVLMIYYSSTESSVALFSVPKEDQNWHFEKPESGRSQIPSIPKSLSSPDWDQAVVIEKPDFDIVFQGEWGSEPHQFGLELGQEALSIIPNVFHIKSDGQMLILDPLKREIKILSPRGQYVRREKYQSRMPVFMDVSKEDQILLFQRAPSGVLETVGQSLEDLNLNTDQLSEVTNLIAYRDQVYLEVMHHHLKDIKNDQELPGRPWIDDRFIRAKAQPDVPSVTLEVVSSSGQILSQRELTLDQPLWFIDSLDTRPDKGLLSIQVGREEQTFWRVYVFNPDLNIERIYQWPVSVEGISGDIKEQFKFSVDGDVLFFQPEEKGVFIRKIR